MQQSWQTKREVRLQDAAAQQSVGPTNPFECPEHVADQLGERVGAPVGQRAFGMDPHAFVRVELGGVAGEVLEVQPALAAAERPQSGGGVNPGVVEQDEDVAPQVTEQLAQEGIDLVLRNVVGIKVVVETEVAAARAHRDARDHRHLVAPSAMAQERRLSARRPGLAHRRDQQEPRFVGKDQVCVQPYGLFFTRGQLTCVQRAMAASSRSAARRSGF